MIKSYGGVERGQEARYSPPKIISVTIRPVMGNPDYRHIFYLLHREAESYHSYAVTTFYQLTNAFSKKLDNLKAAVSLHFFHYNLYADAQVAPLYPRNAGGCVAFDLDLGRSVCG